jgi:hypothetical protein
LQKRLKPPTFFEFNAIAKEYLGFRAVWLLRSEILVFNFGFFGPEQRINASSAMDKERNRPISQARACFLNLVCESSFFSRKLIEFFAELPYQG